MAQAHDVFGSTGTVSRWLARLVVSCLGILLAAVPLGSSVQERGQEVIAVRTTEEPATVVSSGGDLELRRVTEADRPLRSYGGRFELAVPATRTSLQTDCDCLCFGIFTDGFEAGDTSSWSMAVGVAKGVAE